MTSIKIGRGLALGLLLSMAACRQGGETTAPPQAADVPAAATATAPAASDAATAPAGTGNSAVDTCALLDAAVVEAVAGKLLREPTAGTPQGSLLGECNYLSDKGVVMLSARPAAEYRATVDAYSRKGGGKPAPGFTGEASLTSMGLMIQPPGKAYFLIVYPLFGGAFDEAAALELGKQLKS